MIEKVLTKFFDFVCFVAKKFDKQTSKSTDYLQQKPVAKIEEILPEVLVKKEEQEVLNAIPPVVDIPTKPKNKKKAAKKRSK